MKKAVLIVLAVLLANATLSGCWLSRIKELPSQYSYNNFNLDGSVKIDVYVNDVKIEAKVFPKDTGPDIAGPDNLEDYTQAQPIADFLEIEFAIVDDNKAIKLTSELYGNIEYPYEGNAKIINDEVYINFGLFRVLTEGSLKQDDASAMFLYTGEYERSDLPVTLEDCYKRLDEVLDREAKECLRDISEEDLAMEHFGLGLWIRNNWLIPEQSKLTHMLYNNGVEHIDNMSSVILEGYVRYLNNEPCSLEDIQSN